MAIERVFRNLQDFVLRAEVGDRFTDPRPRSITTYVMRERLSETKATVEHIRTTHFGRDVIGSMPAKSYRGSAMNHELEARNHGSPSTRFDRFDTGLGTLLTQPAARFSAKTLEQVHQQTLALHAQATVAYHATRA